MCVGMADAVFDTVFDSKKLVSRVEWITTQALSELLSFYGIHVEISKPKTAYNLYTRSVELAYQIYEFSVILDVPETIIDETLVTKSDGIKDRIGQTIARNFDMFRAIKARYLKEKDTYKNTSKP